MKRVPFTPREHLVVGARLTRITEELWTLYNAIASAYGPKVGGTLCRTVRQLDRERSELDAHLCAELPLSERDIEGVPVTRAYYGWRDEGRPPPASGEPAREVIRREAERILEDNPWKGGGVERCSSPHLIPTARALIGWSYHPCGRQVGSVIVLEAPAPGEDRTDGFGPREWQAVDFTYGACDIDWLNGQPTNTPEGVFGEMLFCEGFASKEIAKQAVQSFATIEECGWARAMLGAQPTVKIGYRA